jgi:hypothetical protein
LPKGGWYVEESIANFQSDEDFNRGGERAKKPFHSVYSETAVKNYVEYGLADRWNLLEVLPYRRSHSVDDYDNVSNAGFRDFETGVKWRWRENPVVVSFALNAFIPTGYNRSVPLALGDARGNLEGRVLVSRDFNVGSGRLFLDGELAKDRYHVPFYAEVIHLPLPWLFTKFYLVGQKALPSQPDGEDFMKWNLGVGLTSPGSNAIMRSERDKTISLTLLYGEIFQGRNSGHGSDVTLAVALVF